MTGRVTRRERARLPAAALMSCLLLSAYCPLPTCLLTNSSGFRQLIVRCVFVYFHIWHGTACGCASQQGQQFDRNSVFLGNDNFRLKKISVLH